MDGKKEAMLFWEHEFGDAERGRDFAGRVIHKNAYGQAGSAFGWNIDELRPQSIGGKRVYSNCQITRCDSNSAHGDKVQFVVDGVVNDDGDAGRAHYKIMRTRGIDNKNKALIMPYANHYAQKDYAVVLDAWEPIDFQSETAISSPDMAETAISSLTYGKDGWVVIMSKRKPCIERIFINGTIPLEDIKSSWDDDFVISNAAYGGGKWVIVMKKGKGWQGGQKYFLRDSWDDGKIEALWKEKYKVTDAVYNEYEYYVDEEWREDPPQYEYEFFVVGSKDKPYGEQQMLTARYLTDNKISALYDERYSITNLFSSHMPLEPLGVVMSKCNLGEQKYFECSSRTYGNDTYDKYIQSLWDEDYWITDIAYIADRYVLVGSKNCGIKYQECLEPSAEFPLDEVRECWNEEAGE